MNGEEIIQQLLDDHTIQVQVAEVWEEVFSASKKVIEHANLFGFEKMGVVPTPNIHDILLTLRIFNSIIDILLSRAESMDAAFDETRIMLNAKQQLLRMEMIANALKANDKSSYEHYIKELSGQSCC